jgi:hypothetical protein
MRGNMNKEYIKGLQSIPVTALLLIGFLIIILSGCSEFSILNTTTGRVKFEKEDTPRHLKKKIAFAVFEEDTPYKNEGFEKRFQEGVLNAVRKECPEAIFIFPGDEDYPPFLSNLPRTVQNRIDNFALTSLGRGKGYSTIITGLVTGMTREKEKRGILWFKDTEYYIALNLSITVYDTETGAKLMDVTLPQEVEIDILSDEAAENENWIPVSDINETITDVAKKSGETAGEIISDLPWRTYVLSTSKAIVLSSGKTSGLLPGDTFDVYAAGRVINGKDGDRFLLPGERTGRIKVVSLRDETAETAPVEDSGIKPGDAVRFVEQPPAR